MQVDDFFMGVAMLIYAMEKDEDEYGPQWKMRMSKEERENFLLRSWSLAKEAKELLSKVVSE